MTHRIRMARKRLMVARERRIATWRKWKSTAFPSRESETACRRWWDADAEFRTIERRKDRIS